MIPAMEIEVRFMPSEKRVRVARGTPLLEAAREAGLPIAAGCSANGLCARCGVVVLDGRDAVSAESDAEAVAKRVNRIDPEQRLACMASAAGDVTITATYW
jgi:2Fe-2S ferredoxin